jgi:hypothetical protein
MSESEQAQTIAEIRKRHLSIQEGIELGTMRIGMPTAIVGHNDRAALLEIVDSQAQKIKEQAARISELEKEAREHVCCLANNGW